MIANNHSQMFTQICDLMNSDDFKTAQEEYLNMHKDKFEMNEEENQFEHTTIHEGYIYILETIIDTQLRDNYGHSDQQIKAFYQHFLQNYAQYQTENSGIVETLLDFVDFNKFKESILQFKLVGNEPVDNRYANTIAQNNSAQMYFELEQEDVNDPANGWEQKGTCEDQEKGFSFTYWQKPQENGINMMRKAMYFEGLKPSSFDAYMLNIDKEIKEQNRKDVKEFKILERDQNGQPTLMYSRSKMTMMQEREMLIRSEKIPQADGSILYVASSAEHPDYPITDKYIRMDMFKTSMMTPTDNGLSIVEFSTSNMGGWFPMRLLNMLIGSMMKKGITDMVTNVKKYQIA